MGIMLEYFNLCRLVNCVCVITYLSIVGVVGKTNIALNKRAQQSTVYQGNGPERAVDGIKDSNYFSGSCTHTNMNEPIGGWWEVDLGENYDITSILIVNRGDCCGDRLRNFNIQGGITCVSKTICYVETYSMADAVGVSLELSCVNFTARYIKVQLNEKNPFSLCEVEVYGELSPKPLESPICFQPTEEVPTTENIKDEEELTTEPQLAALTTVIQTTSKEAPTTELGATTEKEELTTESQIAALITTIAPTTELGATTEKEEELTTQPQFTEQTNTTIETANDEFCSCSCRTIIIRDANVIAEAIQEIKDNLTVNTDKLSSTIRKKTSAKDERVSATSVGYLGIILMSVVFGFFVFQDLLTVIWYILVKLNIVSEIKVRKVKPASPLMPADIQRPAAPGSPPNDSRLVPR